MEPYVTGWDPQREYTFVDTDNTYTLTTASHGNVSVARTILHHLLASLATDVLAATDDPALAWQSLTTAVLRMAYYDWLPAFTASTPATTAAMAPVQAPLRARGLAIAAAVLGVHVAAAAAAAAWFVAGTRYSLLGNAWQAVAQLKAAETEGLLDGATMADDAAVAGWIEGDGEVGGRGFRVAAGEPGGRVCLS
ncbi:uncharacterized protein LTHEOB_5060 [Neofusicoccum parvum]|uniref:Uncharacterized protein LTHEOB_5060 n=1 Tax=Neofusicoccum parvum TaxID=310453 RepID=A0ACB5SAW3_9PEZI|nr:uncharacterized protein LTHEOB_5060 [Neofusicoccum parvum]